MEDRYFCIRFCRNGNEQISYIKNKLEPHIQKGGQIDVILSINGVTGTILLHAILNDYDLIVRYCLDNGADISKEIKPYGDFAYQFSGHLWNAVELSIIMSYHSSLYFHPNSKKIFNMLKQRCLELYTPYGLTSIHFNYAFNMKKLDSQQLQTCLDPRNVNKTIDLESAFWGGMSPLLIAAKFFDVELATILINLGASSKARDSRGNTPLHYLSVFNFCHRRLFLYNELDTFGSFNGRSHFHIACLFCPETLDIVKDYLDQGISPNLPIQQHDYDFGTYGEIDVKGTTGLHVAGIGSNFKRECYPELAELLIEYGADIHIKNSLGKSPLDNSYYLFRGKIKYWPEYASLLLEAGASLSHRITVDKDDAEGKLMLLRCICKLFLMNENLVSKKLRYDYRCLLRDVIFNEADFAELCLKELSALQKIGLKETLINKKNVRMDFKENFGHLRGKLELLPSIFPIYGRFFKIKLKRNFLEYEKKKGKVWNAMPIIKLLVNNVCLLPDVCAEKILWYFSVEELDEFIAKYSRE